MEQESTFDTQERGSSEKNQTPHTSIWTKNTEDYIIWRKSNVITSTQV